MSSESMWPHDDVLHAWWVVPGRLLAGEYPASISSAKTAEKVGLLVDAGIDSIVDLTTPADRLDSYEEVLNFTAEKAGRSIRHFSYPIPDVSVIDQDGYDRILTCIRGEMDTGKMVYVHC